MATLASRWSTEIVTPAGLVLLDLSGRAKNRRIIQSRNEAEEISWEIDLNEYELACREAKLDSASAILNNSTEIRIKRLNQYLCGGQVNYKYPHITPNSQTLSIRATGFLNLFKDRYTGTLPSGGGTVQESFTGVQKTTIASTLITQTQAKTNGNWGVTIGLLATVGTGDKSYSRTNIKQALQDMTQVQTNPFDFEFTYNKVFNTYASLGSERPSVIFEYPRNIREFGAPDDGTQTANDITALGSGFGTQTIVERFAINIGAQQTSGLREKIVQSNGTDDSDGGVQAEADRQLAAWGTPYELPTLVVDGNLEPFVTDYGIGDRVKVIVNGYASLTHINSMYRVEKRIIDIDENDNETVTLILSS